MDFKQREKQQQKPSDKASADKKTAAIEPSSAVNWRIPEWFPDIDPAQQKLLKDFHSELLKFNKTVNLISVKTILNADAIHFADCILAARLIVNTASVDEIYDIGSGNGFPGIIFAILFPNTIVHLVEIDQRKAEFLKHAISTLGLKNADVLIRGIEHFPPNSIKFAVSRGFAPLARSIMVTRKSVRKGGRYFHMKGEEWAKEVGAIPSQLCTYWLPGLVAEYRLPVGEVVFAVVKTEKVSD